MNDMPPCLRIGDPCDCFFLITSSHLSPHLLFS